MLLPLSLGIGLSLVLSLALTPLAGKLAVLVGAMDVPDTRKVHKSPIPRLGGLAVAVSFFVSAAVVYLLFPDDLPKGLRDLPHFLILIDSVIAVLFIGVCDDVWTLRPGQKFAVQMVAGALVYIAGYRLTTITNPFGGGILNLGVFAFPATVFWVVGITNSFNLIDGLDGLAAGVAVIAGLTILGVSLVNHYLDTALFAALLVGSVLGFLKYNFNPAKIFLGDSGSLFLGFMLSVISIRSSVKGSTAFSILVPLLALGLPIMDTGLAVLRRLMRSIIDGGSTPLKKKLHSLFLPDRRHIHHQLLAHGLSHRNAVLMLYSISFAFGICAFLVTASNLNSSLILLAAGVATVFMVRKLGYREMQLLGNGVILHLYNRTILKKHAVQLGIDILSVLFSFLVSEALVNSLRLSDLSSFPILLTTLLVSAAQFTVMSMGGMRKVEIRLLAVGDFIRITKCLFMAVIVSMPLLVLFSMGQWDARLLMASTIDFYLLGTSIIGSRVSFHVLNHLVRKSALNGNRVLIYGANSSGLLILQSLLGEREGGTIPVGFLDDDPEMEGKFVDGYKVFGGHWRLESVIKKQKVSQIYLSSGEISPVILKRIRKTAELCTVPVVTSQIHFRQINSRSTAIDPEGNIVTSWQRPSWSVSDEDFVQGHRL